MGIATVAPPFDKQIIECAFQVGRVGVIHGNVLANEMTYQHTDLGSRGRVDGLSGIFDLFSRKVLRLGLAVRGDREGHRLWSRSIVLSNQSTIDTPIRERSVERAQDISQTLMKLILRAAG